MSGLKITPADHWFSLCVRERAGWKCERCETQYIPPTAALHCAHYQTRDDWTTRLEPLVAFCLCHGCHRYFDKERRFEFEEFFIQKRGREALDILTEKWRDVAGLGKEYKRTLGVGEVAKHYKNEYERMLRLRSTGSTGWIDFQGWL